MATNNMSLDNDGQQAIGQWWQITSYWTIVTNNKLLENGDR
jgi:hypothetical protein